MFLSFRTKMTFYLNFKLITNRGWKLSSWTLDCGETSRFLWTAQFRKNQPKLWKNLNRKYNFIGGYLWMFWFTMVEKWTVESVRLESLGTSFWIEEQVQSHKAAFRFFTISSDSGLFPHLSVVGANWPSLTRIGQLPLHFSLLQFSSYKIKWYLGIW